MAAAEPSVDQILFDTLASGCGEHDVGPPVEVLGCELSGKDWVPASNDTYQGIVEEGLSGESGGDFVNHINDEVHPASGYCFNATLRVVGEHEVEPRSLVGDRADCGSQQEHGQTLGGVDPEGEGRCCWDEDARFDQVGDAAEDCPHRLAQFFSQWGEEHGSTRADEEGIIEQVPEAGQRATHGWLGEVEFLACFSDAGVGEEGTEGFEQVEVHGVQMSSMHGTNVDNALD